MFETLWLVLIWSGGIFFAALMILGTVLGLVDMGRSLAKRSLDGPSLLMLMLCTSILGFFAVSAYFFLTFDWD